MRIFSLVLLFILSLSCFQARAESSSGPYLSVKMNRVFIDDLSGSEEEFGFNLGGGYSFGILGIEYEHAWYNATIKQFFSSDIDVKVDTDALYLVARSTGDWFVKAKAGVLREEIEGSVSGETVEGDDTGGSVGLGFGFQNEEFRFEVELTKVEEDINALSVGFNLLF